MKNAEKISQMLALALALTLAPLFTNAMASNDKLVEKAREAVKNADDNDWQTLNKSAKVCIRKGVNMEEALVWINKSISINKNMENLELRGDYYFKFGNNRQAMISYVEVIKFGNANIVNYDSSLIEAKIAEANK